MPSTTRKSRGSVHLTERWFPLPDHAGVRAFLNSKTRFNVVPAGRRSYKTETAKRRVLRKAFGELRTHGARYLLCAPTREQAKRIFWNDLKLLIPKELILGAPRESELIITLINTNELHVVGMDRPMRVEGATPIAHALLDEYADMEVSAWEQHIGPGLSDLQGSADFIGVPEGRNHYYRLFRDAQQDTTRTWAWFTWKTDEFLPPEEIKIWKSKLSDQTYAQEFEASFVTYLGLAYSSFSDTINCSSDLPYDPKAPLVICFDFNRKPGVVAVCQEAKFIDRTLAIGEVFEDQWTTTPLVCNKLLENWGRHEGLVLAYGDATGGAGGSAAVEGSNWVLVEKTLKPVFGDRLQMKYKTQNPRQLARVNAVNSRLRAADGSVRFLIDPMRCPYLVRDFGGVRLVADGTGEIDKRKHREDGLSHISDAVGYYIEQEFPVSGHGVFDLEEM